MRLTAVLALTTLVASASPVDAKCAMDHLQPIVITKEVAVPADGGGIVVGTQSVSYHLPEQGDAVQKDWGFITGRDLLVPVIRVLAPGLAVYSVRPNARTTGELTDSTTVVAKLTLTKNKVARLPAPKLVGVVHEDSERTQEIQAELDGAPPTDAVALVVFDARRKAKSWGTVAANATTIEVYGHHKCDVLPNGTIASKAGDKVMLAWVDKYGRLSAMTKVLTIQVKK